MRQYWKRWLGLLVFVIILGAVFVRLGEWQLHRLEERRERNAAVVANSAAPPVPFADAFGAPIGEDDQWQRVTATGTFDHGHDIIARYRHLGGRNGYQVVTPLVVGDRTVLVDRGFVESSPGAAPVALPGPQGTVTVTGYVRRNEVGKTNAMVPADGAVRLINAPAIAGATGLELVDGYLQLIEVTPAQDARYVPVGTPDLGEGPHLSYALQWFSFCGIGVAGLFVFIRGDIRDRRKAAARAAAKAGAAARAEAEPE